MSFLQGASGTELVFWAFALSGTLFFALRVMVMIVGGFGADSDVGPADLGGGHDVHDVGADGHHSHDLQATDPAFKLVSINSITGFLMMFGWGGLTAYSQFQLGATVSILIAFAAGLLTMAVTASLFKFVHRLSSPGDVYTIDKTVGCVGSVYMKIPAQGRGKVQVICNGVTRFVDALSESGVEIDSFQEVQITKVVDPMTVMVRKWARSA
ncbi:MAG: hypothetical protein HY717_00120 [Planctomycetes bacterium]|nr:hypothetical protein [Planctomycetota bacterium]